MQIFWYIFYCGLLSACTRAQLILLTSVPDTNGSYCPGRVTFTCNGTNVANGLQWIINGKVNSSFFLMPADTDFPRTVSQRNNVTITVIKARTVANSTAINLVSTLTVDRLNPILNSNVYCQFFSQRSSTFFVIATEYINPGEIKAFLIFDTVYKLFITWNTSDSRCEGLHYKFKLTLTYSLNNSYSADVICRTNCEASFPVLTNNAITKYMAEVWAINNNGELVGMPSRKMIDIDLLPTINSQTVSFTTIIENVQGFTTVIIGITTAVTMLVCFGAMMTATYCYKNGLWKRQKPCHKSPDHEYENITRNCTAIIEESYKTSRDNKVEKMEDNVAYSIHNTTLMTMTDCEAYGVPKTPKNDIIGHHYLA